MAHFDTEAESVKYHELKNNSILETLLKSI